jgi:hypothetical protein
MRLRDVGDSHHELLRQLAKRISKRLDASFVELPGPDTANIGIQLSERNRSAVMELHGELLLRAGEGTSVREAIRVRMKARRDRMLSRQEPAFLGRQGVPVQPAGAAPGHPGGGFHRGRR